MIISASRRTGIPAFYLFWFMTRIRAVNIRPIMYKYAWSIIGRILTRAGFCAVPNPFARAQVSAISLLPDDVVVIVF